ncbi:hypothetical protein A3H40_02570 [Candidatus Daviesbacteria bacterium RIFCSPLOWO2_02_FULL_38_15]|uniref:Glycosyltransferase 2-like domain-containing protein n=1 Tax=Candidatus Daviesbacteria bacterium RIFCSPLOWO2_02_FULL_38_15 TaxID=1797794 RepID=A0A1F5N453_9BACT|nr:MAG: hypothetical protein A3H40_02570 [Candidatus Daviesbacteria bacterium RIFCSPLOWO2_02_FULL_38_15]
MKIWANCIVHNEENFIWFAVMSVIDYADKVLVWDTGSTDKTIDIIREIREIWGDKVDFREVGSVDKYEFTKMRQAMLEESDCDWILILDGDEIWWRDSIEKVISRIHEGNIEGIVVPMVVPVGDIYHLQEQAAGRYKILGKTGHLSLKAFSKAIPCLHVDLPYGKEGFLDEDNHFLQERKKIIFLNAPFLHVTHLKRSSSKRRYEKFKYELGKRVEDKFKFPEVFYQTYPSFIPSPWLKIEGLEKARAQLLTPLRKLKRRLI